MSHVSTSTSTLPLHLSSTCSETNVSKQVYCFTKSKCRILIFSVSSRRTGGLVFLLLALSVLVNVSAALAPFMPSSSQVTITHQELYV